MHIVMLPNDSAHSEVNFMMDSTNRHYSGSEETKDRLKQSGVEYEAHGEENDKCQPKYFVFNSRVRLSYHLLGGWGGCLFASSHFPLSEKCLQVFFITTGRYRYGQYVRFTAELSRNFIYFCVLLHKGLECKEVTVASGCFLTSPIILLCYGSPELRNILPISYCTVFFFNRPPPDTSWRQFWTTNWLAYPPLAMYLSWIKHQLLFIYLMGNLIETNSSWFFYQGLPKERLKRCESKFSFYASKRKCTAQHFSKNPLFHIRLYFPLF